MRWRCLAVVGLALAGCARRTEIVTPKAPSQDDAFLELKAGYRLRVITPMTRSGGYRVATAAAGPVKPGEAITLRTTDDFLGYETAYYAIEQQTLGVRIRFLSAQRTIEGTAIPAAAPKLLLFETPRRIRHMRLVYLIRQSVSDHDMAFLGADTSQRLDELTRAIRANSLPCEQNRNQHCAWVPAGIAVRAEMAAANGEWVPVR
jgi:hypothetical protein